MPARGPETPISEETAFKNGPCSVDSLFSELIIVESSVRSLDGG